jgi:hypothetical protein
MEVLSSSLQMAASAGYPFGPLPLPLLDWAATKSKLKDEIKDEIKD